MMSDRGEGGATGDLPTPSDAGGPHMGVDRATFRGPLFIVGRPRSGTKLLRTLLNEHSRIAVPVAETAFVPYAVRTFGSPPPFTDPGQLHAFFTSFERTLFFRYGVELGIILDEAELQRRADVTSWPSIVEEILKFYSPKTINDDTIWGDKSPNYLTEMPLLRSLFPEARFLHIIRDPRDHCLSVVKTWRKNPLRAATMWRLEVGQARSFGRTLGQHYHEVRFEDLITEPESTLQEICGFLGLPFEAAMMDFTRSYEDLGDAAGALRIVGSNVHKYRGAFKPGIVRRIEEITYPVAVELGYELEWAKAYLPQSRLRLAAARLTDAAAMTRFYSHESGLGSGLRYLASTLGRELKRKGRRP